MGNLLELEKLHVAVHLGFDVDDRKHDTESEGRSAKLLAEIAKLSETIAGKNEALVVLHHKKESELEEIRVRGEEHGEWPIIPMIDSIQHTLERRMILITGASNLKKESCQKYVSIIQAQLKGIGFCTHEKTRLLCMGIWAGLCVSWVAKSFPPLLGMKEKGLVRLKLTNAGYAYNSSLYDVGGAQLERLQREFPEVNYLPISLDKE